MADTRGHKNDLCKKVNSQPPEIEAVQRKDTMSQKILDLSDIVINEEDADKLADLPQDKPPVDAKAAEDGEDKAQDKNAGDDGKKEAASDDKGEDKPEDADKNDGEDKGEDKEEKKEGDPEDKPQDKPEELTPFHKHPDWIKMQEENKRLAQRVDELSKKPPEDKPQLPPEDPQLAHLSPQERAAARVRKEVADKTFEPADTIDATQRYNNYLEEELKRESTKINRTIDDTFTSLGLTDRAQQDKVIAQVAEWKKQGFEVTPKNVAHTLRIAHDTLKKTGAFNAPSDTNPQPDTKVDTDNPTDKPGDTPQDDKPTEDKTQQKKSALSKIHRPKGGSEGGAKKETSVKITNARNKSIDEIVLEAGSQLEHAAG